MINIQFALESLVHFEAPAFLSSSSSSVCLLGEPQRPVRGGQEGGGEEGEGEGEGESGRGLLGLASWQLS